VTRGRAVALVALAILLASWPLVPTLGTRLFGHPFSEVDNHFWMATFGGRADAPMRNLPGGFTLPLMDPVNLVFWGPGSLFGPVFAYDLGILGNLALAAAGAALLAGALGAGREGRVVAAVAAGCAPFLLGMGEFGITEALPVGWLAIHVALVLRAVERRDPLTWLGACAALSAFLLSGWYHTFFALFVELGLGLWLLGRPQALPWFVAGGLFAGLPLVPLWRATRANAEIWAPRLSALTKPEVYTDWATNPRFGTDLLNFFVPAADAPVSRTVYLGAVVLALAFVGATRRGGALVLGLALPLWVLAIGHWLRIGGVVYAGMPAGLLVQQFEVLRGISHWYRAAGPAVPLLAAAAGLGASVVLQRSRRPGVLAAGIVAAIVLESVVAPPVVWPRVTYVPDPPEDLLTLSEPGGLLQLPIDEGRGLEDVASKRVYEQWQVFHGRAIAEHYEGRDVLLHTNPTVARWQRACARVGPRLPEVDLHRDIRALLDAGVTYVVVHPEYARKGCAAAVAKDLGEPDRDSARAKVWTLPI
jgi:hypothetical protein